ncbi:MAG: hypothetical protein GTO51_02510 [Candidatus Latescibacteria bacterium]|nr:hypothetical protein [Candidatus Latescibacterota bacterium]NIM22533.1 hypothetical protein [Candidatus Latescibacterota bacterium]NIM64847.1 hypothetical protein [Candidatus Latescibacterota bacterium]NIO01355.1 hypothetical protein [Candidatus Latescibacterota bacterium]NIO27844.1 hypothetical protein [Candidatus Latescibacterota bacterium]
MAIRSSKITRMGVPAGFPLLGTGTFVIYVAACLLSISPAPAGCSDITIYATLEPRAVVVGDQATLVVTVEGRFSKGGRPELPSLTDIDVYGAGSSQSFSIVNGQMSASVSFTYILVPRKEGTYTIEPIQFTVKDKVYKADPVILEAVKGRAPPSPPPSAPDARSVRETAKGKNLFIQADAEKDTAYVNEQITWRLGFYTDGRVRLMQSPNYTPPEAEGFWVEDLPPVNKYYATIDNKRYHVSEIKRAYFPTAPGEYVIGSARVEIMIDDWDPFSDDFFTRPLRSFGFGKPKTLSTKPVTLTVLPLPERGKPKDFTGIVGRAITLDINANKQVVQVGEPVNITLKIEGEGNVKTIAAPPLRELEDFKVYESGSSSEVFKKAYVVSGRKRYEYVLVPKVEGKKTIPAVRISYFDPVGKRYETAQSRAIRLDVKPGVQEEGRRIVFAGGQDEIEVLAKDVNYIHPVPSVLTVRPIRLYQKKAYAVLHVVPLLAVFLSLAVERRKRKWRENVQLARAERAAREALRKLGGADKLLKQDRLEQAFSAISSALLGYLADKMNAAPAGLTLEAVENFLERQRVEEDEIAGLRSLLNACDAAKYSAGSLSGTLARETLESASRMIKSLEKRYLG